MKKFTKLFLSCAAVAAITAAIGVSAMAADVAITGVGDNQLTGTYDSTAKAITSITLPEAPEASSQITFLVYEGAYNATEIAAAKVDGIDQNTTEAAPTTSGLPTNAGLKSDADGVKADDYDGDEVTYTVKVGYYQGSAFKVATGQFKLGKAAGTPLKLGDVNGDGAVGSSDSMAILFYEVNQTARAEKAGAALTIADLGDAVSTFPKTTKVGDVNGDGAVGSSDAMAILFYEVNQTARAEQAGKQVTGTIAEN